MTADSVDGCAELEALLDHFNKRLFLFASLDSELTILEVKKIIVFVVRRDPEKHNPRLQERAF